MYSNLCFTEPCLVSRIKFPLYITCTLSIGLYGLIWSYDCFLSENKSFFPSLLFKCTKFPIIKYSQSRSSGTLNLCYNSKYRNNKYLQLWLILISTRVDSWFPYTILWSKLQFSVLLIIHQFVFQTSKYCY